MRLRLGAASILVFGTTLAALPISAPLPSAAAAKAAPAPPRIMIVGDSVAHQFDGDYTWRYRLGVEFKRQKEPVDFVGPFRWGYGQYNNYLAKGWDSDHGAQGATVIKDFLDIKPVPGAPNWGKYNIARSVAKYQPHLIVAVMGNNDVNNAMVLDPPGVQPSIRTQLQDEGRTATVEGRVDLLVSKVLQDFQSFVASARKARWNVRLVIGEITSQLVEPWVRDRVNAALVSQLRSTANSTLVVAQSDDPKFALSGYTVDGIHTTPTGDMVMAQRIAQAVNKAWKPLLGAPPKIPQVTVAWNPVLKPTITVSGNRLKVDWGLAARRNTVLGIRVKFINVKTRATSVTLHARTPSWTSAPLSSGKYTVQLQGVRGNMLSTWGTIYPVTVP